jgi:predicted dehydrogenase
MKDPLRFAVIGAGAIAGAYESAFARMRDARITAVCDVRKDAAEAFGKRVGCAVYTSVESLAVREEVDAVVICTPPVTHEAVARAFLERGVHVLCEKPLATTVSSAMRMLAAAERGNAVLTMASKFRYVDDVRMARSLLRAGGIGDLIFVENAFTSRVDMIRRWNSDAAISGGGVLIDNGTHAVDILRYFLGNLRAIQTIELRRIQPLTVEDTVRLYVRNEDGVMGASDLSWSIDKELETFLRVYGSEGTILVGWHESKYRRRNDKEWRVFGSGYDKVRAFQNQLTNFCDAIRGRAELAITPEDALASVEVITAAYMALQRTHWQSIGTRIEEVSFVAPAVVAVEAS